MNVCMYTHTYIHDIHTYIHDIYIFLYNNIDLKAMNREFGMGQFGHPR